MNEHDPKEYRERATPEVPNRTTSKRIEAPDREGTDQGRPRVWIGSLADYNAGRLHGEWIPADVSDEEMLSHVQRILRSSAEPGAEEWGIFDYEGFGSYAIGQHEPIDRVAGIARGIAQHGTAFAAWAQLHPDGVNSPDIFEEAFLGEYASVEDWAQQTFEDLGMDQFRHSPDIPDGIRPYLSIDYGAWGRDAELNGMVDIEEAPSGGVYVFREL